MGKTIQIGFKGGMHLKDELRGIDSIWELYRNEDVRIFCVEVTMNLKGQQPVWFGSSVGEKNETSKLMWLDPTWGPKKGDKIKRTYIDFGPELRDFTPVVQASRYTLFVSFFRRTLLAKAIEHGKPIYDRLDHQKRVRRRQ